MLSAHVKSIVEESNKAFSAHELAVRLDQGPYRSYRCQRPETWLYYFDVTFIPGSVYLTGDIGHVTLSRELDMLPWLRGTLNKPVNAIDWRYLDEETPRVIASRQWSEVEANEIVDRVLSDHPEVDPGTAELLRGFGDEHDWAEHIAPELWSIENDWTEYGDACDWASGWLWPILGLRCFVRLYDAVRKTETAAIEGATK